MFDMDFKNKKNLIKAKAKFRALGITVNADDMKSGAGGSWEFATDKQIAVVLQEPLAKCGLEFFSKTVSHEGKEYVVLSLVHVETGESESSYTCLGEAPTTMPTALNLVAKISYITRSMQLRMLDIPTIERRNIGKYNLSNIEEVAKEAEAQKEASALVQELIDDAKDKEAVITTLKAKLKKSTIKDKEVLVHRLEVSMVEHLVKKFREVWAKRDKEATKQQAKVDKVEEIEEPKEEVKKVDCAISTNMNKYYSKYKDNKQVEMWLKKTFPLSFDGEFNLHEDERVLAESTVTTLMQRGIV
jgi:hypothetical protein